MPLVLSLTLMFLLTPREEAEVQRREVKPLLREC
jgi:hypothetical protein